VPNLKDIRRRISTVEKTQQITRAMRMVAGAKLRRAQDAIESARPYAERMRSTLDEVARSTRDVEHPLLEQREARSVEVVIVTSDRGLCGAFNANVIKAAQGAIGARADAAELAITTAGRKGREFFKRTHAAALRDDYPQEGWVTYAQASHLASALSKRYADGDVDEVVLIYSEFVSTMNQSPRVVPLLPLVTSGESAEGDESLPYEIEPSPEKLLATLIPRAVEVEIFRALLENQAGEHAARMAAMESATRNTEELIETLTLQYNRARQAAITKELVEIVSGAEAL
jgi:F-type H+-transporting ATPase subunit gamma